jgi:hypothetical protein
VVGCVVGVEIGCVLACAIGSSPMLPGASGADSPARALLETDAAATIVWVAGRRRQEGCPRG